ncbi:DUF3124 domain-containing protein [Desulfococcaceae bacterium HSG8]|nr:DUF3124 domain-containing protein [Desulfococcaceae bacterium HSG8]
MISEMKTRLIVLMLILVITGIFPGHGSAFSTVNLLKGQSVYVSIYSHIYHGDHERPFDLTATLSIRNTDPKQEITLVSADYFDSDGNFLKNYVEKPVKLKNLASIRYVIKGTDKSGGSGAKFIVRWESKEPVNPPLIEAIMISTKSQQGISFISRGIAIKE